MSAVRTELSVRALQSALQRVGALENLGASASPLAIGAMNWAAWENRLIVARRTTRWRTAVQITPGTRREIWSSKVAEPRCPVVYDYGYSGRWSGKTFHVKNDYYSHSLDAMAYVMQQRMIAPMVAKLHAMVEKQLLAGVWDGAVEWSLFEDRTVSSPEYKERATLWQLPVRHAPPPPRTAFVPSQRGMWWNERPASQRDKSKNRHGLPSWMPRKSTA